MNNVPLPIYIRSSGEIQPSIEESHHNATVACGRWLELLFLVCFVEVGCCAAGHINDWLSVDSRSR